MKTLLLLSIIFTASLFGQATSVTGASFTVQPDPLNPAETIQPTYDSAVAGANWLFSITAPGTSPTTLTAAVTSTSQTTLTLASVTGIVVGNGICFSPSASTCAITLTDPTATGTPSLLYSTPGEVDCVTAINGNVVTVKRASIGTAATYSTGQAVTIVRAGNFNVYTANVVRDFLNYLVQQAQFNSASALAAQTAITNAQAALKSAAAIH